MSLHDLITAEQKRASAHLYGMFPRMVDIVKPCTRGDIEFKHVQHSEKEAYVVGRCRNELRTTDPMVQMNIGGMGWMFDTLHEKWMNRTAVIHARGDVLIGGLGMGLILWPILRKRAVRSVTVIENNTDVRDLILPTLETAQGFEKLTVEIADARTWVPTPGERFDYIWLDCVPAYGYTTAMLKVQQGWIEHFSQFHRAGSSAPKDTDNWGFQENLLWHLHGDTPVECWPKEDRRAYPIGPSDPLVRALIQDTEKVFGFKKDDTAELMAAMAFRPGVEAAS